MNQARCFALVVAFLVTLPFRHVFAQQDLHVGVHFNPYGSLMINSEDFDDPDKDPVGSFSWGTSLLLGYHFNDRVGIGIAPEFLSFTTKYKVQEPDPGLEDARIGVHLNYVRVPLLFRFNGDPEAGVSFQGSVGPYVAINTGAKWKTTGLPDRRNGEINEFQLTAGPTDTIANSGNIYTAVVNRTERIGINQVYAPITIGAMLNLGVKIKAAENLFVDILFRLAGDFTNAQASYEIGTIFKNGTNQVRPLEFWDMNELGGGSYRSPLGTKESQLERINNGPASSFNAMVGGQMGITYVIGDSGSGSSKGKSKSKSKSSSSSKKKTSETEDGGEAKPEEKKGE
jgi:hypothetical protein